jgi:superfamily I DNA and/or RNA helicase
LQSDEIDALHDSVRRLVEAGLSPEQIIAISPFRAVARELERLTQRWPGLRGGTIHTAQGRQAPVVFLILGGDPAKPGARRWAAEAPNLLNVAASRAQRRLYIIGDQERWGVLPYFQTASRLLASGQTP